MTFSWFRCIAFSTVGLTLTVSVAPAFARGVPGSTAARAIHVKARQSGGDYTDSPGMISYGTSPMVDASGRGAVFGPDDIAATNLANEIEMGLATIPTDPGYNPSGLGDTGDNQSLIGRPGAMPRNKPGSFDFSSYRLFAQIDTWIYACSNGTIDKYLAQTAAPTKPISIYANRAARAFQSGGVGDNGGGPPPPTPGTTLPTQGMPFPWEGTAPGGGSSAARGYVNTQTGNRLTVVPLVRWNLPGDSDIDLTLYHNSQANLDIGWGMNWRSTYDMKLFYAGKYSGGATDKVAVTYADGRVLTFSRSLNGTTIMNRFYPPTRFLRYGFQGSQWLVAPPARYEAIQLQPQRASDLNPGPLREHGSD